MLFINLMKLTPLIKPKITSLGVILDSDLLQMSFHSQQGDRKHHFYTQRSQKPWT